MSQSLYKCTYPGCPHPGYTSKASLGYHRKTCQYRNDASPAVTEADRKRARERAGFECTVCSATFGTKVTFTKHMYDEHDITKCSARDCEAEFDDFGDWKRHRLAVHQNEDGLITSHLENRSRYKAKIDYLEDIGAELEQYNPPGQGSWGGRASRVNKRGEPHDFDDIDEFDSVGTDDLALATFSGDQASLSQPQSHNQNNHAASADINTNGKLPSTRGRQAKTIPKSILKDNNEAPTRRSPPTPRPRVRVISAKQAQSQAPRRQAFATAFARMAFQNQNPDPLPIRRPLPTFDDDSDDSSFESQDSSESGSGSGSSSSSGSNSSSDDDNDDDDDGEREDEDESVPPAKRKKLSGLESLKRTDPMGNVYYHHPDDSESDEDAHFRYRSPSPPASNSAAEKALFVSNMNRNPYMRQYLAGMTASQAYKLFNPGYVVGLDHPDTSNWDFDDLLQFPPKKPAADAATAALKAAASKRQRKLIYPPPMPDVRMEFMTSAKVPKTWDVQSYQAELAAEKKAKEDAANAGNVQANMTVAATAATDRSDDTVVPVKRPRKIGSRSKTLPRKPKRGYKWKDSTRKNKGWKIDAKAKEEADGEDAEEGDDEEDF